MYSFIKEENLTKVCKYVDDYREFAENICTLYRDDYKQGFITKETYESRTREIWSIVEEHNKILRMLMPPTEV